jgi:hypothetical protein
MESMKLGRQIAGLAAAALIAAAMLFAPTIAQAHVGHSHTAVPAPHAEHVAVSAQYLDKAPDVTKPSAASTLRHQEEASAGMSEQPSKEDTGTCTGSCCGLGCCGAVLTVAPHEVPNFVYLSTVFLSDFDYSAGTDPDALRRPPRHLA